ncbi:MAG: 3-oxoacyl-ACP reductase FabG [Burkholderiaceae bacterium]
MRLKNKVAIVTGAASGIGLATAEKFVREGARVVMVDLDQERLSAVCDTMAAQDQARTMQVAADVTQAESLAAMAARTLAAYGRIDILVNNAGITMDARLAKMSEQQFDRVVDVNLKGVFLATQAVLPAMLEQKAGVLINVSSVVGLYGNFGQSNYAATKAGVIGFVKTWARELGPKGIRSVAVCPGFVQTPILETIPADVMTQLVGKVPLGRLGKPAEVANVYAFLASDEASYVNGAVIEVSGGIML